MRESVAYQDILEEGRLGGVAIGVQRGLAAGRVERRAEGERRVLLRQATRRFGEPSDAIGNRVDAVTDLDTLDQLADRVLIANTWEELLADLA